jgi:hypothetical protein
VFLAATAAAQARQAALAGLMADVASATSAPARALQARGGRGRAATPPSALVDVRGTKRATTSRDRLARAVDRTTVRRIRAALDEDEHLQQRDIHLDQW